jgi:branched-chain amino acid transport system substrate-binding protein
MHSSTVSSPLSICADPMRGDAVTRRRTGVRGARRFALAALAGLAAAGCGGPRGTAASPPAHSREQSAQAARRYDELLAAVVAGSHAQAQDLALRWLDAFPGAPQESDVLLLGARAARAAGDDRGAAALAQELVRRYPNDARAVTAQALLAALQGRTSVPGPPAGPPAAAPSGARLGLLCPLTGEYAALGQAMVEGARIAVQEHDQGSAEPVELVSRDTAGDGVRAVLGARELIDAQGVVAVVGELLSSTTIAAAAVCQERSVPLVSPTATQATISDIGGYVFQTNLTSAYETSLLARAATEKLLKRRFAVLHPDDDEGRAAADMFQREIERRGGRIVAREGFERDVTDFKEIVRRLRAAAPEALFLPCGPVQLRLIAPQLTFYQLEVQLLGPSSWSSAPLAAELAADLDRAVVPGETALMSPAQRDRFDAAWRRAHGDDPASPFALKTYLATAWILEGLAGGARTRGALRDALEQRERESQGEQPGGDTRLAALRVLDGGAIVPFPIGAFPRSKPAGAGGAEPQQREPTGGH